MNKVFNQASMKRHVREAQLDADGNCTPGEREGCRVGSKNIAVPGDGPGMDFKILTQFH
jgi:hypothetical protein